MFIICDTSIDRKKGYMIMILNTGSRTDIPAFYSTWFYRRIQEGYVCTRNPYYPHIVHRYRLNPEIIDVILFCTKDPTNMIENLSQLVGYRQLWYVTVTPYGKDIEPYVRDKYQVMDSFHRLSSIVGKEHIFWRYDPIFVDKKYTVEYHLRAFEKICANLSGYTSYCIISFIDLYEKTKRNFPEVQEVSYGTMHLLTSSFVAIAQKYGISLMTCAEDHGLDQYGIDITGCMSQKVIERATGLTLSVPVGKKTRNACACLLGNDIGEYNTCGHFCKYCYANVDRAIVKKNMAAHDPNSPLLVGKIHAEDEVRDVVQKSWLPKQLRLPL